ncbi:hypothetical protein [Methanosarcina sp. WWM596]|uniref:hypothetical protein n=1 Tax=Methanosarcina sp. WWM596 TaxID=1434103 RepID=UPI001E5CC268|nr:hypothetical protein [Methanosarcina sp. WWM596]
MILILIGVIIISGCVDSQAQPSTYKAPGDIYSSIFDPHGLPGHEIPDMHIYPRDPPSDMPPEGRRSAHSLQNAKFLLDENLEKAEFISSRLDPGVQYLKEQGKDVSRLESLLEEYRCLVEEAKNYRALAASSSGEEDSSSGVNKDSEDGIPVGSSEKEYLIQSQKSMIRANLVLKDIFDEFKRLMPGSGELKELDRLSAEGDGRVTLIGRFDLNLHLQEGEMAIMELSPDSTIQIEGDYTLEIRDERQENVLIYHIQSADVEISGSRKMLLLSGENITVEADGEGYAAFFGNGTYSIEDADGITKEEQWAVNSFFEEKMSPERPGRMENRTAAVGTHGPEAGMDRKNFIEKNPLY